MFILLNFVTKFYPFIFPIFHTKNKIKGMGNCVTSLC